ncbi:heterokaryon incompatibility protein-domain-containing protein [Amylocarpus encephaloides]|uniref:Heterokaryon incompatibility protein-domain-containing protein n=1 Tax=Amylocarpus encephaloides TaxID=45428 RepID=A0A9P8C5D8_9HELO|nr:heterokaryon incompatibility protein-domain-containing protein [Amylocarpus encephaloides]
MIPGGFDDGTLEEPDDTSVALALQQTRVSADSEPEKPLFKYIPLPSPFTVRLVSLDYTAEFAAPLEFDFKYFDRDTAVCEDESYDAVSHVWGEPEFDHHIYCRGTKAVLKITAAVDRMLRHFRRKLGSRPLWIDAICLNQADEVEKRIQVPKMGAIYHQARSVHIWLGDTNPNITDAFRTLHNIALRRMQLPQLAHVVMIVLQNAPANETSGDDAIEQIQALLHNPWFQRRWVIQEASFSHDTVAHCGESSIRWTWLADGLHALRQVQQIINFDEVALNALRVSGAIGRDPGTILEILWQFHGSLCSDAQDRIFAICGLANDLKEPWMTSEDDPRAILKYSNHWADNYTLLAQHSIKEGNLVAILRHLSSFGTLWKSDSSRASWVPNWSADRAHSSKEILGPYDLAKSVDLYGFPEISQVEHRKILMLHGKRLGNVSHVYPQWPTNTSMIKLAEYLNNLCRNSQGQRASFRTIESLLGMLCLCLRFSENAHNVFTPSFTTRKHEPSEMTPEETLLMFALDLYRAPFSCHGHTEIAESTWPWTSIELREFERQTQYVQRFMDNMLSWGQTDAHDAMADAHGSEDNSATQEHPSWDTLLARRRAMILYLASETGRAKIKASFEVFLQDVAEMMDGRVLFRCKEDESRESGPSEYFIGSSDVQENDIVIQLTKPRAHLRDEEVGLLRSPAFLFRPFFGGGTVSWSEVELRSSQRMFRFVGSCYAYGVTEEFDAEQEPFSFAVI